MREPRWRLAECRGLIVSGKPSTKQLAWAIFDRIVADAAETGYTNPWIRDSAGELRFEPDFVTLGKLLGVPLFLEAPTQSGVPALALDVWVAYELRRASLADITVSTPVVGTAEMLGEPLATSAEVQQFYQHLEQVMTQTGFLDPRNPRLLMRRIARLYNRVELTSNEVNILRGILTSFTQKNTGINS